MFPNAIYVFWDPGSQIRGVYVLSPIYQNSEFLALNENSRDFGTNFFPKSLLNGVNQVWDLAFYEDFRPCYISL